MLHQSKEHDHLLPQGQQGAASLWERGGACLCAAPPRTSLRPPGVPTSSQKRTLSSRSEETGPGLRNRPPTPGSPVSAPRAASRVKRLLEAAAEDMSRRKNPWKAGKSSLRLRHPVTLGNGGVTVSKAHACVRSTPEQSHLCGRPPGGNRKSAHADSSRKFSTLCEIGACQMIMTQLEV